VGEDAAGISETFAGSGAALQQAQDKIATMQPRVGDIQQDPTRPPRPPRWTSSFAALKAEIGPGDSPGPREPTESTEYTSSTEFTGSTGFTGNTGS